MKSFEVTVWFAMFVSVVDVVSSQARSGLPSELLYANGPSTCDTNNGAS